jgi:hypothetical protein
LAESWWNDLMMEGAQEAPQTPSIESVDASSDTHFSRWWLTLSRRCSPTGRSDRDANQRARRRIVWIPARAQRPYAVMTTLPGGVTFLEVANRVRRLAQRERPIHNRRPSRPRSSHAALEVRSVHLRDDRAHALTGEEGQQGARRICGRSRRSSCHHRRRPLRPPRRDDSYA